MPTDRSRRHTCAGLFVHLLGQNLAWGVMPGNSASNQLRNELMRVTNPQYWSALRQRERAGIEQRQYHRARLNPMADGYSQPVSIRAKFYKPSLIVLLYDDLPLTWRCTGNRWRLWQAAITKGREAITTYNAHHRLHRLLRHAHQLCDDFPFCSQQMERKPQDAHQHPARKHLQCFVDALLWLFRGKLDITAIHDLHPRVIINP